jgi:REP element-mobilizing transposase RayT
MARIARIVSPRKPHLVCQSSEHSIFNTPNRRRAYLDILADCADIYKVKALAWSILQDRVYFVLVPPSAAALSSFMRVAHTRFARRLHADGLKGEVTPRRFASCALDNEAAKDAIKFVESRPVAAKLAKKPGDYAFGSASLRDKGKGEGADLLTKDPAITGRIRGWAKWHATPLTRQRLEYLAMRMRTGKPAGAPAFIRRIEQAVGMNLSRGRGRPKGS